MPPTNEPGASRRAGSRRAFTAWCSGSDEGGGPQSPSAASQPPSADSAARAPPADLAKPSPSVGYQESWASLTNAAWTEGTWVGRPAKPTGPHDATSASQSA